MKNGLLGHILLSLDTHKAEDLTALAVGSVTSIADYFVLATGTGATHVRSLADYVEEELSKQNISPLRSEGYATGDWVTLDYGTILVHIFRRETRDFYDLERLWTDAAPVDIAEYLNQQQGEKR